MPIQECVDAIHQALGRPPTEQELDDIASAVQARLKAKMDLGLGKREAAQAVQRESLEEAKLAAAKASWRQHDNLLKKADLNARGNDPKAETSVLSGLSASDKRNAATSVELRHKVLRDDLLYKAQAAIDKAGLRRLATSRDPAFELRLAQELYRRDDPTLAADTGDVHAKTLARIYGDVLDGSRAMQNKQGAFIGQKEGYMGRQNWDMMKVRGKGDEAAYQKWKKTFGQNRSKDFEGLSPEQKESLLRSQWQAIKSGIYDNRGANTEQGAFSLANKISQERSINFDSPEAWVRANQLYGKGGIADAIYSQADAGARNAALMERFGSTPKKMFQEWHSDNIRAASARGDEATADKLRGSMNVSLFNQISGLYDTPGNHTLATIGANVRAMSQLLHLGQLMTQAIVHIPLNAMVLRRNGVPFLAGMAGQMRAIFPPTAAGREIASAAHAGLDGMFHGIIRRFHTEDGSLGQRMSAAVNLFYKANGFGPFMDNQKAGVGMALTHSLGQNAGKALEQLDARMQTSLRRYGIEAAEWDGVRATAQRAADGRMHLIPSDIEDKALADKFQNYVSGEIAEGANEPTAYARNIAAFGTQPGTWSGEISRTMMQFKSFAITMAQRQWGANMRGGMDVPGTMLLASMMTAFGFLSLELKGIVRNQYQGLPTDAEGAVKLGVESMTAGGAFGLFADAFLRDGIRSGGDFAKQLFGPVGEPIMDLAGVINNIRQGPQSQTGRSSRSQMALEGAHTMANDLMPNFWATQAAYNYIVPYSIANMIHPGVVQRHEKVMRANNQSWILPPGH